MLTFSCHLGSVFLRFSAAKDPSRFAFSTAFFIRFLAPTNSGVSLSLALAIETTTAMHAPIQKATLQSKPLNVTIDANAIDVNAADVDNIEVNANIDGQVDNDANNDGQDDNDDNC